MLSKDKNPELQRPYLLFGAASDHGDERILVLQNWIEAHIAPRSGNGARGKHEPAQRESSLSRAPQECRRHQPGCPWLQSSQLESLLKIVCASFRWSRNTGRVTFA